MKSLLSALSLFALVSTAPAAVLVNYTFSGSTTGNIYNPPNTNSELFPSNVAANTTASNITQAGPIAWRFQTGSTNMSIYPGNTASGTSAASGTALLTSATAVAAGSYFTFTITAVTGYHLDMSSLTFDAAKGGSGSRGFAVQTSATAFSTDSSTNINSAGVVSAGANTLLVTTGTNYTPITFDFSGAAYQGLSSLEIRVFSYSTGVANSLEYDNFALNGAAAIPEPATWALLTGAGTTMMVMRRRRRN